MVQGCLLPRARQSSVSEGSLDLQNTTLGLVSLPSLHPQTCHTASPGRMPTFPSPEHHKPSPPYESHCVGYSILVQLLFLLMNLGGAMDLSRGSESSGSGHRDLVMIIFLTLTTPHLCSLLSKRIPTHPAGSLQPGQLVQVWPRKVSQFPCYSEFLLPPSPL